MTEFTKFSDVFLSKYKDTQPPWGFGALSYITYKRTYARFIPEENRKEEWWETIRRCIEGAQEIGAKYTVKEAERLFDLMFDLKCSFAGRPLWQLGTDTVRKIGANSLLNCWFVLIDDIESFIFLFDNLMLGGGVGYSVRREHVHELPKVKDKVKITHKPTKDADFIIPDSREGWSEILRKVFQAYFITGKSFSYSTILIRGAGERINTFGGISSGPLALIDGIQDICNLLDTKAGKKLRSIDALDLCNILGKVVISGNVRRGAQIAIGDIDDVVFMKAKRWDLGPIPSWRANSNNSVYCEDIDDLLPHFWEGYSGNGESYGLINLQNCRRFGRSGEKRSDKTVEGVNPCGEIPLSPHECCNLQEIFLNNIKTKEELNDSAILLYKTAKAICTLPFVHEETNRVVHKNMRIGIGVTGVCQAIDKMDWLYATYNKLREFDAEWSKKNNLPESIRLTTAKPSGTVSLLAGATPGVHPGFSTFHIRRVRMSSNDELIDYCRKLGYHVEYAMQIDGTHDYNTSIVSFPCKFEGNNVVVEEDITIEQQMDIMKKIQTVWADNAVSCTIYFEKDEIDNIKKWLKDNYTEYIKSISFCLKRDAGFIQQMPLEAITQEEYEKICSKIKPIVFSNETSDKELDIAECDNGSCPIK